MPLRVCGVRNYFYPRPPHGGRLYRQKVRYFPFVFLPTPSAWRATAFSLHLCIISAISTHALRMEGDCWLFEPSHNIKISTHALRMEGDRRKHLCRL